MGQRTCRLGLSAGDSDAPILISLAFTVESVLNTPGSDRRYALTATLLPVISDVLALH
eukprot:CCRYP_013466-RG/>CCRYP_013466-RG protein AED:0.46 eAED:0.57 QI:0/0/0/1/1/0/2/0/57